MPEPEVFAELSALLDALDALPGGGAQTRTEGLLATFGLGLLDHVGWGLELGRCVVCGRERPPGRAAVVVAARGGVICRSCGGTGMAKATPGAIVDAIATRQLSQAAIPIVAAWVREALAAHTDFEER
jgi:DNA repair protein RecO (recombination protein O)